MKIKILYEPIYRINLFFVNDCHFDDLHKITKKYDLPPIPEDLKGNIGLELRQDHKENELFFIWIEKKKDFYCLLHEISHLIIDIFDAKGMTVNNSNTSQEAFAYLQEYYFKTLWRFMNTPRKGK